MSSRIFYKFLVIYIYLDKILSHECPKRVEVGKIQSTCSTEMYDQELLSSFYVENESSTESLTNQYIIVFAVQSISFISPDNLQLLKLIELNHRVTNYQRVKGNKDIYYICDKGMIFKLIQETLSFKQVLTIPSNFSEGFAIQSNLEYIISLDIESQNMINLCLSSKNHSQQYILQQQYLSVFYFQNKTEQLLDKGISAYRYSEKNKMVIIRYMSDTIFYQLNIESKVKEQCQFHKSLTQILVVDIYIIIIHIENNQYVITIYEGNCYTIIKYEYLDFQSVDRIVKKENSFEFKDVKISSSSEKKYLYLYGNNLVLIRFDFKLKQFEGLNSKVLKDKIDTTDSDFIIKEKDGENDGEIDGNIYSIDILGNQIAFATNNTLFVYNYALKDYVLIKYQKKQNKANSHVVNVIFWNENIVMQQFEYALQKINIYTKRIEYDTRCLQRLNYVDEDIKFIHISQNLDKMFLLHDWGKLYQLNKYTGEYEKLIIDLKQRTVIDVNEEAERIFIGKNNNENNVVYSIDYFTGSIIYKIKPIWKVVLKQIVISNINNIVFFIDQEYNIHTFKCQIECQSIQQLQCKIPITNIQQIISQKSSYIIYNSDNQLQLSPLNDTSANSIVLDINNICKSPDDNLKETIISTFLDESNQKIYLITSESNLYVLSVPKLTCIYKFSTLSRTISLAMIKRSVQKQLIFISDGLDLIAINEANGKKQYSIQLSQDTKILDFTFDDQKTDADVQIFFVNAKGQFNHYIGNFLQKSILVHDKSVFKQMIIDLENKILLTQSELTIIKYNYEQKAIVNQWVSPDRINILRVDYKLKILIHTSQYEIYFKDYDQSYLINQQTYPDKFIGGFIDVMERRIYGFNTDFFQFDYNNFNKINTFQHNKNSIKPAKSILSVDLIRQLNLFLTFNEDGSMSVFKYKDMEFIQNYQFEVSICKYPIGGTYHDKSQQYYVRCERGSIYILQYKDNQFYKIKTHAGILDEWKVTQIIIAEKINRVFLTGVSQFSILILKQFQNNIYSTIIGQENTLQQDSTILQLMKHVGQLFIKDPVHDESLLFAIPHKGWIYDVVFESKDQILITCGEDGSIQQWQYKPTTLVANKIFQNSISVKSLIYDSDIDIVLAFDIEGNILVLKFSTLIIIKKIISQTQQVFIPYIDFKSNLVIGFSGNNIIVYDYASILRDYHITLQSKKTAIESFTTNKLQDEVIFQRNDGYLQLWNTTNYFLEYLTYLPKTNGVSSKLYYFENDQVILIVNVQAIFLYNLEKKNMIQSIQKGCDNSYIYENKIIICIYKSSYSRIVINKQILQQNNIFTLEIKEKNDQIKGLISQSSQNKNIFAYCSSKQNDLYIYSPISDKLVNTFLNHHDSKTKILSLQVFDKYLVSFDQQGVIKLRYGNQFEKIEIREDFKNNKIYDLIAYNETLFYVKNATSVILFKVNINNDQNMIITKSDPLQINCFGRSSKFYKNNKDIIIMVCSNDLIQILKITNNQNNLNIQQIQKVDLIRNYMLQNSKLIYSFFLTDQIFALEYEDKQILLFLDEKFVLKKSNKNPALDQQDFNIISKKQENDKVTVVFYDLHGLKIQTWPLLNTMQKSVEQDSCYFEEDFLSATEASNLLKQISNSYSDYSKYLNIKKFDIILNMKFSSKLDSTLNFDYKNLTNLTIKGIQDTYNPVIQTSISKQFIDDCQLFDSFQIENLEIYSDKENEVLEFNNYKRLRLINLVFKDIINQKYIFNNTDYLFIQCLHVQHIRPKIDSQQMLTVSKVQILNVQEVWIDQLEFRNCTIVSGDQIAAIKIQNSTKVKISQLYMTINNLYTTYFFQIIKVEDLEISNSTINNNNKFNKIEHSHQLFLLQHISNTVFEKIEFSNNENITFVAYQNFIKFLVNSDYITTTKSDDTFTIKNVNISDNKSYQNIMSIISSNIQINALNATQNIATFKQLISFENSKGIIQDSFFDLNHSPKDNMLKISDSDLSIQNSIFKQNKINQSLINIIQSNLLLIDSNFTNNYSEDDGCVMRVNNKLLNQLIIKNNKFEQNNAKGSGGVLYLIGYNTTLKNNQFIQNIAGIGGAIRYQQYVPMFMEKANKTNVKRQLEEDTCGTYFDNQCTENFAFVFGKNIGSNPRNGQLSFLNQSVKLQDEQKQIKNIRSGENSQKLHIILFDERDEIVQFPKSFNNFSENLISELQSYKAQIQVKTQDQSILNQQISIEGTNIREYTFEGFNFNQFLIKGIPGSGSDLQISISCIYKMKDSHQIDLKILEKFDINMKFRECIEGEIINQICQDCLMMECKQCQDGTYSLTKPQKNDPNQQCKKCQSENTEGCHLNEIKLKKGFWRESINSDEIVECLNSKSSCEGTPETNYCIEGFIGPLCEVCDARGQVWGKPYGKSYLDDYSCNICQNSYDIAFHFIFTTFFILYTSYTMVQVVKQSNLRIICYCVRKMGILLIGRTGLIGENTQYFKLLIHHLQLLLSLKQLRLNQFKSFFSFSQAFSVPTVANANSIDCFLHHIKDDFPHYILKFLWSIIYVSLIFIVSTIIYRIYVIVQAKKQKYKNYKPWYINYSLSTSLIFFMFIIQQGLIDTLIKIASCRKISGKYFIQSQISEECYSQEHLNIIFFFILPILIIAIVIWPLHLIIKLNRKKEVIDSSYQIIKKLGFLYFGYKKEYFYWEFIKIYERILIVLVINYVQSSQTYLGMILFITLAYCFIFIQVQPYRDRQMNRIENFSSKIIVVIFLMANITSSTSGIGQHLALALLFANVTIQILGLISSIISNLLIANQNTILKIQFFRCLFNFTKKNIQVDGYFYLKLKHHSPTLFKMIFMPQSLNSFNKFILWRKIQNSLKNQENISLQIRQRLELQLEQNNLKYFESVYKNSNQLITVISTPDKVNRRDSEKQKCIMTDSEKVSIDGQSLCHYDEYQIDIKDEASRPKLNTVHQSKIGPNQKLSYKQSLNSFLQQGISHNVLNNCSTASLRLYSGTLDDSMQQSKGGFKNQLYEFQLKQQSQQ